MEGNIPNTPNPAVAGVDSTSDALSAVRNLVTGGRNAGLLRSMFNGPAVDPKAANTALDKANVSVRQLPRKPSFPAPGA